MMRRIKSRARSASVARMRFDFDALELSFSPEDLMADLRYGADREVGVRRAEHEARRPAGSSV